MAEGRRLRLRVGDVIAIPLGDHQAAVSHIVGSYKKAAYYFAVYAELCPKDDRVCIESRLDGEIAFLGLSMDAKIAAGHWTVVTHRPVDGARVPFPAYIEGVSPPGSFDVVDHLGKRRRPARPDDMTELRPRKVVAPARIEKALRALHGLEPWHDAYDELRVPAATATSSFRFQGG